jgi:hypothetical protein
LNWSHILDQAGNIGIGLVLLFVGLPIVVLVLTFLGKLVVNIISWPLGLAVFASLSLYRWLVFKLFGKQVLQSIFSQFRVQAEPSVLTSSDGEVHVKSFQDAKPTILDLDFREDETTPFGFTVTPKDTSTFKKTEVCMHLDSPYVRMSIWGQGRCINFLFDKNKNHISWEQRTIEVESFPPEEKLFGVDYKVIRTRCVIPTSESNGGTEYCADILYYQDTRIACSQSDIVPIQTIYEKHLEDVKKSSLQKKSLYEQKRIKNKELYLNPKTPRADRMEILYEEVGCEVATLGYHFMVRDSEALFNSRNYAEYCSSYFSKVENPEENYIDYLKAYFYGLREAALDDIEGDKELDLIKQLCKDANLLHVLGKHKSKNPQAGEPTAKTEYESTVEKILSQIQTNKTTKNAEFDRTLVGRRLLQMCGSRTVGTKYRFSGESDNFWLALESDTSTQLIWLSPQWKYRGPNTGFELGVETQVLEVGQQPALPIGSSKYSPPSWQALTGLFLSQVHSKSAYEEPHVAALALSFKPALSDSNSAKLLFDSPDLDDPFIMFISDDKLLRHWALREDVLDYVDAPRRAWDAPWNTPVYPWDFEQHFEMLSKFRQELQGFVLWLTTEAVLIHPKIPDAFPTAELWTALRKLSVFEIALARGLHLVEKDNSWLDRDGEVYGSAWVSLGLPYETEKTIASSLRFSKHLWRHLMTRDEWQRMIDTKTSLLNFRDQSERAAWTETLLTRVEPVEQSLNAWESWFFQCNSRVTTNE